MMPFPGLKKAAPGRVFCQSTGAVTGWGDTEIQIIRNQRLCLCPAACDRDV